MDNKEQNDVMPEPKKKGGNVTPLTMVLVAILVLSLGVIYYLHIKVKRLEARSLNSKSYMTGDKFSKVELLPLDNREEQVDFAQDLYLLLYFKSDCSDCVSNKILWNHLAMWGEGKIKIYGIVPTSITKARQFQEKEQFRFPIFVPLNVDSMQQQMQITPDVEHTILIFKKKVIVFKMGTLSQHDLELIMATIKEKFRTQEKKT